ncbi:MAG: CopD family protein [Flavobacteriales bacterium]|nr:CopD family protein [Flavobacteriales bacterium]
MLPHWYPALLALHLVFMVTFFTGTFWLLRLFILHRQAQGKAEPARTILMAQYMASGRQLLYMVAWPSLLLMILFGGWMLWLQPSLLAESWMQVKLELTVLVFAYHLMDQQIYRKLRGNGRAWGLFALTLWAQLAVLLLVLVVFLSTFKAVQWYLALIGLLMLVVAGYAAAKARSSKVPAPPGPGDPGVGG